jgi:twinkle protein
MNHPEMVSHLNEVAPYRGSHARTTCPMCGPDRKKRNERTLSVTFEEDSALYMCHHCHEQGRVKLDELTTNGAGGSYPWMNSQPPQPTASPTTPPHPPVTPIAPDSCNPVTTQQFAWLKERGIGEEAVISSGLMSGSIWIRKKSNNVLCIGFPYTNEDGSKAVKWRDNEKSFTQTGVAKSLWKLEDFDGGDLIITEGEMDALSFMQVGIHATSAPNGAPEFLTDADEPVREGKDDLTKYSYLWDSKEAIAKATRIIIATDGDTPGNNLAEEIARRIGKAKCWRLQYPEDCKDPNDILVKHGEDALKDSLSQSVPWPIGGLRMAIEYKDQAMSLYRDGMNRGVDTGIDSLSRIFKPTPGTLTVCTGIPSSGKSTFLLWLSKQLAVRHDWRSAVFAAETSAEVHLLQLAALRAGKPFMGKGKMSEDELSDAIDWTSEHFIFLDEADTSIDSIIVRAQAAVMRHGVHALVVDPFNFITMDTKKNENDTNTITKVLVKLKGFAVEHAISVWLIAHPRIMYRVSGQSPTPTGYDVSGSAGFFNVADNGLTVERIEGQPNATRIVSWKSRFSWIGSKGEAELSFDPNTGEFSRLLPAVDWGDADGDWDIP